MSSPFPCAHGACLLPPFHPPPCTPRLLPSRSSLRSGRVKKVKLKGAEAEAAAWAKRTPKQRKRMALGGAAGEAAARSAWQKGASRPAGEAWLKGKKKR